MTTDSERPTGPPALDGAATTASAPTGGAGVPQAGSAALSWRTVYTTYLPALVLALGTGVALPAVPALAASFDVSFGAASGVVTAFLIGNLAGTVPSGWLIDHVGRRRVMILGPLFTAVMSLLVVGAHTFPELLIYRFLGGFAAQMWLVGRLAAISEGAATSQRGRQVSWMFGMDNTGKLAGPLVGGFIAAEWGLRAPFIAFGVLALLALLPALLSPAQESPLRRRAVPARASTRTRSLRAMILPRLVFFGLALFAGLTRGPVQADLLHLYAAFTYALGPQQIGYLASGAALLSLPIGFLAGWIMDRFGRKRTMVPGFVGVAVAMAALALSAFVHLSLAWYVVLFLVAVAAQSLTGGSIQTIGADVAPPEARGMFLGLWRFAGQGGASLSPIVFALLADQVSYGSSFVFVAMCAAVVAFLLIRHVPETGGPD